MLLGVNTIGISYFVKCNILLCISVLILMLLAKYKMILTY